MGTGRKFVILQLEPVFMLFNAACNGTDAIIWKPY